MALNNDFARFKAWLRPRRPSEAVLKICAVIEANLARIAQTTHAGGQRSRLLVPMLRAGMDQAVEENQAPEIVQADIDWDQLACLEVGPFRGFRRKETFDLSHSVILILGGNGTGKSSLCEAMELALLGRIEEADERGLRANDYLRNSHEGAFVQPLLLGRVKGAPQPVAPSEELYRFIIVERNRIEGCARIGARRPAEATKMLAALFGLTAFNDFVSGFAASIENQLTLGLPKAEALGLRRAATLADQTKVASVAENHAQYDRERAEVAERFETGLSYADLKARIGTPAAPGRLKEIRDLLAIPLAAPTGVRTLNQVTLRRTARNVWRQLNHARKALEARSREVTFRGLYQAVAALEAIHADRCPACETPLGQVVSNPFRRATDGLHALRELAQLEEQAVDLERQFARSQDALQDAIDQVVQHSDRLPREQQLAKLEQPFDKYGSDVPPL